MNLMNHIRKKLHKDLKSDIKRLLCREDTIYSYINNDFLRRSDYSFDENQDYQYVKAVHGILSMNCCKDLKFKRIGNSNDGGYVMRVPPSRTKIAYSLGISNDVSWDLEIANMGYEVFQYDHTIKRSPIKNEHFHWRKNGIGGSIKDKIITMEEMLRQNGHFENDGMLLKMDIEGSEWDALYNINLQLLYKFDQILIELHDFMNNYNRDKKIECLKKLTNGHKVVHLHGNNYDYIHWCNDLILPNTIEVTLLRNDLVNFELYEGSLPTVLDAPNDPMLQDILIGDW